MQQLHGHKPGPKVAGKAREATDNNGILTVIFTPKSLQGSSGEASK